MSKWYWSILAIIIPCTSAVDNGVEGDPIVDCQPTSITVNITTRANFSGEVYARDFYPEAACRNTEKGRNGTGITLHFYTCGVKRARSSRLLAPKGIFVTATVTIIFHEKFITKPDRTYHIQCFYAAPEKVPDLLCNTGNGFYCDDFGITTLDPERTPTPLCRYEILAGGATGEPVAFALVGDLVYHKWTCETETVDKLCMVVHSCFVDDGGEEKVDLLTNEGCAIDTFLFKELDYQSDLIAGHSTHVFKYADKPQLFFQCKIDVFTKELGAKCPRPTCPSDSDMINEPSIADGETGNATTSTPAVLPRPITAARDAETEDVRTMDVRTSIPNVEKNEEIAHVFKRASL